MGQLSGRCFPWRELFGASCSAGKSPGIIILGGIFMWGNCLGGFVLGGIIQGQLSRGQKSGG